MEIGRARIAGGPMWYRSRGSQPTTERNAPVPARSHLAGLESGAHVTIVRTGGLGDTILVLPTLAILRGTHPNATFTLVGSTWAEALQPLVPFATRTVHIDRVFPPGRHGRGAANVFAASQAVILYTATVKNDLVSYVRSTCPGSVAVWPVTPAAGIHAARHLANVLATAPNGSDALPMPELQCPHDDRLHARDWLDQQLGHGARPVAVHPGSGGTWKCWPAQRFANLAARLRAPILLVEGPADADACRAFAEALAASVPVARATGMPLSRVAALLSESRGYIGNDSGVSHLAAALGVPTVAVFGPTDPAVWAPLGPEVSVVTARADAPWSTVDDVLIAAQALLDNRVPDARV
jgi:heptosyltransferase-2